MLANSYKTAAELGITEVEVQALIKVLGMLERGELRHERDQCVKGEMLFNMGSQGKGCGTPACIGGWVALMLDRDQTKYVDSFADDGALNDLYWGRISTFITAPQAAHALRNFLTTGDADWKSAVNY